MTTATLQMVAKLKLLDSLYEFFLASLANDDSIEASERLHRATVRVENSLSEHFHSQQ